MGGRPALWITYVRPDAVHTSLLAGIAYLDMTRLTATLHAGTDVPGGGPWVHGARIAPIDYPRVIAAFNSAFRLDNSRGGYFAEDRTVQAARLRPRVARRCEPTAASTSACGVATTRCRVRSRQYVRTST